MLVRADVILVKVGGAGNSPNNGMCGVAKNQASRIS